ncbi:UNVERIFIED_CONTAM: hypothetical protein FKN15_028404 [Acipenser sinensis]
MLHFGVRYALPRSCDCTRHRACVSTPTMLCATPGCVTACTSGYAPVPSTLSACILGALLLYTVGASAPTGPWTLSALCASPPLMPWCCAPLVLSNSGPRCTRCPRCFGALNALTLQSLKHPWTSEPFVHTVPSVLRRLLCFEAALQSGTLCAHPPLGASTPSRPQSLGARCALGALASSVLQSQTPSVLVASRCFNTIWAS